MSRKRASLVGKKPSKAERFSVRAFFARFPDDDTCLAHVMTVRYGMRHTCRKCGVIDATFYKLKDRPAYVCGQCGDHVHPCAGTIFQDSRTPLVVWFYAIYLFVVTRHGVSGKELQRHLGVTYKTAWRMGQQIRLLMGSVDEFQALKGHVEIDEHFHGGHMPRTGGKPLDNKVTILGMKERGGRMVTEIVPDVSRATLRGAILMTVQPDTIISTDGGRGYGNLSLDNYQHGVVNHNKEEWARTDPDTDVRHHVAHVESFWSMFKRSIRSTHIHISEKYTQRYLDEFTFRSNHRELRNAMFDLLIGAV